MYDINLYIIYIYLNTLKLKTYTNDPPYTGVISVITYVGIYLFL